MSIPIFELCWCWFNAQWLQSSWEKSELAKRICKAKSKASKWGKNCLIIIQGNEDWSLILNGLIWNNPMFENQQHFAVCNWFIISGNVWLRWSVKPGAFSLFPVRLITDTSIPDENKSRNEEPRFKKIKNKTLCVTSLTFLLFLCLFIYIFSFLSEQYLVTVIPVRYNMSNLMSDSLNYMALMRKKTCENIQHWPASGVCRHFLIHVIQSLNLHIRHIWFIYDLYMMVHFVGSEWVTSGWHVTCV